MMCDSTAEEKMTDLERTQELFQFLQGNIPEGYVINKRRMPKLSAAQAWTAVWYIQELHCQLPDFIERCQVCGELYDSEKEGECLDYGDPPYHFCGDCDNGPEAEKKRKKGPKEPS